MANFKDKWARFNHRWGAVVLLTLLVIFFFAAAILFVAGYTAGGIISSVLFVLMVVLIVCSMAFNWGHAWPVRREQVTYGHPKH